MARMIRRFLSLRRQWLNAGSLWLLEEDDTAVTTVRYAPNTRSDKLGLRSSSPPPARPCTLHHLTAALPRPKERRPPEVPHTMGRYQHADLPIGSPGAAAHRRTPRRVATAGSMMRAGREFERSEHLHRLRFGGTPATLIGRCSPPGRTVRGSAARDRAGIPASGRPPPLSLRAWLCSTSRDSHHTGLPGPGVATTRV